MTGFDDHVEELLAPLCDCENYHVCKWHERLRKGNERSILERDMWDELNERHYWYCVEKGIIEVDREDA